MAIQLSVAVRNGMLDAVETVAGASALVRLFAGAAPANCAAADSGSPLATLSLPSDWMAAAGGGTKTKLGTWQDPTGDANGNAGHFRVYDSGGTTCHMQGTVTATGGGGDLQLSTVAITIGIPVTITAFTLTAANA